MPTTPYTQTINYGQRVIMNDSGRETPLLWKTSKVEDIQPIGLTKLTFTQEEASLHEDCGKYMLAGWCSVVNHSTKKSEVCKTCSLAEPTYIDAGLEMPKAESSYGRIGYNGKNATLRVGGSAKTFTAMFESTLSRSRVDRKPSWNISLYDKDELMCSIDLNFDSEWNIERSNNCPDDVTMTTATKSDGCEIYCKLDNTEIFKAHVALDKSNSDALKLKCLSLYSMVGKTIKISAQNEQGQYTTDVDMEVVS